MKRQLQETVKGSPNRFAQIRRELGLTLAQLASKLGVHPNTVARWQRGDERRPPRIAVLAAEYLLVLSKTKKGGKHER